jgi:hypothetical protein
MSLDDVLSDPRVFRPRRLGSPSGAVQATGFAALDARLSGGGWPKGALTELLSDETGIGELRLVMPALSALAGQGRWVVWVSPPHLPYPPALSAAGLEPSQCLIVQPRTREDRVWAVEQGLRSGACAAVLAWRCNAASRHVRRLQLAAEAGDALGLIFRPLSAAVQRSPAALRLSLLASPDGLVVDILKSRGGPGGKVVLPL